MAGSSKATQRFWGSLYITKGCWYWVGSTRPNGYGRIAVARDTYVSSHRFAYEMLVGPIPEGMQLDHICHDPSKCQTAAKCLHRRCVNPGHLRISTAKENMGRVVNHHARKTHCPRGHEYSEENTSRRRGGRECRTCKRLVQKEYLKRRAQDANVRPA